MGVRMVVVNRVVVVVAVCWVGLTIRMHVIIVYIM